MPGRVQHLSPRTFTNRLVVAAASWLFLVVTLFATTRSAFGTTGAEYRKMAEGAVSTGQYARAAGYYRQEASVYRQHGDTNAAEVEEAKADCWTTRMDLFIEHPAPQASYAPLDTHGKFEPVYGCYLGAYVEADDNLGPDAGADSPAGRKEEAFSKLIGKKLATVFTYCHYGESFPMNWAQALLDQGIAPHIALEPN